MKQLVNIKRVQVDSELKVTVVMEYIADSKEAKENVFRLIEMQGDIAEMTVSPAQMELPMADNLDVKVFPMGVS